MILVGASVSDVIILSTQWTMVPTSVEDSPAETEHLQRAKERPIREIICLNRRGSITINSLIREGRGI